ncbi:MAG: hypothetical protein GC190_00415 [Alphaproteobacteria bacterium]|nr:hypothetical protein [Alphaproteobacteria bacterium]
MSGIFLRHILPCALLALSVAACEAPTTAYRPQIDIFAKATAETSQFARELQTSTAAATTARQRETLERRQPHIALDDLGCADAIIARTSRAPGQPLEPLQKAVDEKCAWVAGNDLELRDAFDTGSRFPETVAFLQAVERYSASLQLIATSADKAGLVEATKNSIAAVASLAATATSVTQGRSEAAPNLGAMSELAGTIAFDVLEDMRSEALKRAARDADQWITEGSTAVARVLEEANNELIRAANDRKNKLIDAANGAKGMPDYVGRVQAAQAAQIEFERLVARDPTAPLLKLADAHHALVRSFDDPDVQVGHAVMASLDLLEAAQRARTALQANSGKGTK